MKSHEIVSASAWLAARKELLDKEKAFAHVREELTRARQALPWERVEKPYVFDGPSGELGLADLFDGRSQLIVYHFMFAPNAEGGCKNCSFWADNFNPLVPHLKQRDVTLTAISRAPLAKLQAFQARFGWTFPWVSSGRSDFNFDYQASLRSAEVEAGTAVYNYRTFRGTNLDMPGVSVFYKDDSGAVFHTYSTYARGIEVLNTAYHYLDLTPKGRDEEELPTPMAWVRYRDRYDQSA